MAALTRGGGGLGVRGRVAVVGGALSGLSTAVMLLRKGFRVTVYDRSPVGPVASAHPSQVWTWWPAAWSILHEIMGMGEHRPRSNGGHTSGDASRASAIAGAHSGVGNVWHGHRISVAVDENTTTTSNTSASQDAQQHHHEPARTLLRRQPIDEINSYNWKGIPIDTYPINACNVHAATVLSALASEVARLGGSIVYGNAGELASLEQGDASVSLEFSDGNRAEAEIVVGADGVGSRVRTLMFSREHIDNCGNSFRRPPMDAVSGQLGAREGSIDVTSGRVSISHRPDLLSLYKPDGARVYGLGGAFVVRCYGEWVHWDAMLVPEMYADGKARENTNASQFMERPKANRDTVVYSEPRLLQEGRCERLASALESLSWDARVVSLVRATLPHDCVHRRPCDAPQLSRWHVGRVVLVGDAAHGCMPYGTQGGVLALADAVSLATGISDGIDVRSRDDVERGFAAAYSECSKSAHSAQQRGRRFHASLADSEDSEINLDYGFVLSA
eukprot:Opistho-2@27208